MQLSGPAAFLGPSEEAAYRLAVTEINRQGGLLGRKIELIVADSATDAATANADAKRLVNSDHAAALFASDTSAAREAILPVVKKNGNTPFFYDAIYEGHACDAAMHVMGEVPETQISPIVPYLQQTADGTTPAAKAFDKAYQDILGVNAPKQNFIAINGYDALHLWALAVEKAKSTSLAAVSKALPEVSWTGPRGTSGQTLPSTKTLLRYAEATGSKFHVRLSVA